MWRSLASTELKVFPIGLGAMPLSIQGRPNERTARAVIHAFLAGGGNFIDTAISYCLDERDFGHNERLVASAIEESGRDDIVVATKGGVTRPGGRWRVDCSPARLRRSCEQSARALGTPIRLYYLHAIDVHVPLQESLGELMRLRDEGKILHLGLSNVDATDLEEALRMTPIAAVQNRCNLLEHGDLENGLVERCSQAGTAYVPYAPVGGHHGHDRLYSQVRLGRVAAKHGASPYVIALAWLLAQGPHVLPIPGASKVTSVESSLKAAAVQLDADDLAMLG